MSKHPIRAIDDLFKVTGMEFGIMAEKMGQDSTALLARARQAEQDDDRAEDGN